MKLPEPERIYASFPHQLSGGQRQRIMIAMALVLDPVLLIADEPTTALDVTTQSEILKLIAELQGGQGTGVLFITHDFGVVAEIAHRVAVLRWGELVERERSMTILRGRPGLHPQADLLGARAWCRARRAPSGVDRWCWRPTSWARPTAASFFGARPRSAAARRRR